MPQAEIQETELKIHAGHRDTPHRADARHLDSGIPKVE
jgi:hypothetical protein